MQKQDHTKSTNNTCHLFQVYTNNNNPRDTTDRLLSPTYSKKISNNLSEQLDFAVDSSINYLFSQRLYNNHSIYHSENYKRCKKTCDYIVRFSYGGKSENFGIIKEFFELNGEQFAIINNYEVSTVDFFDSFIIKNRSILDDFNFTKVYFSILSRSEEETVVKSLNIINKCVLIEIKGKTLLTDFLYDREHD